MGHWIQEKSSCLAMKKDKLWKEKGGIYFVCGGHGFVRGLGKNYSTIRVIRECCFFILMCHAFFCLVVLLNPVPGEDYMR